MVHWYTANMIARTLLYLSVCAGFSGLALAQEAPLTLQDALTRAKQYGGQVQTANLAVLEAAQDTVQARAAAKPSLNAFNQYINTQGNGTSSGVFVANDGVHIYNEQATVHQEVLSIWRHGEINRAQAAEAVARAKVDIASRGLNATVIQDYFAIVSAQRRLANAQTSVREAQDFVDLSQKQERGGEAAHADVVKAQIDLQTRQIAAQEAQLSVDKAKIALGVLIFPDFRSDFAVVDDLQQPMPLPSLPDAQAGATTSSPDLKAAAATVRLSNYDVTVARYGYLPSLGIDLFYGWDANQLTIHADRADAEGRIASRLNLGYVAQATLNIPIWNWHSTQSKVKQAELRLDQAKLDQTLAQKGLAANVAAAYADARGAQAQLDLLRNSIDLANESLRLTRLRYQAAEATALEVVDAQNTLVQARNAFDQGEARYRVAIATLQTVTGTF